MKYVHLRAAICKARLVHEQESVVATGAAAMAKVNPYHTDSPEYPPEHRNVYHDHDDCRDGKAIKAWHRKSGTGGKQRCKECIKIG